MLVTPDQPARKLPERILHADEEGNVFSPHDKKDIFDLLDGTFKFSPLVSFQIISIH